MKAVWQPFLFFLHSSDELLSSKHGFYVFITSLGVKMLRLGQSDVMQRRRGGAEGRWAVPEPPVNLVTVE